MIIRPQRISLGNVANVGAGIVRSPSIKRVRYPYYGALLFNWATVTAGPGNGAEVVENASLGGTHCLSLPYNAVSDPYSDAIFPAIDFRTVHSIGFRVSKSGTTTSILRIYLTGDSYTTAAFTDVAVTPGEHLYSIPFGTSTAYMKHNGTPDFSSINTIRFRDSSDTIDHEYSGQSEGESILVSDVRINQAYVPRFCICTDKASLGDIADGWGYPTGYPTSGGSTFDILNHYGFKGTAFVPPDVVGTEGYMTEINLATLYNSGWCIGGNSSYSGSLGQGFTELEDQAAVEAKINADLTGMNALGYGDTALYYALPTYAFDKKCWDAAHACGLKIVRANTMYQHAPIVGVSSCTAVDMDKQLCCYSDMMVLGSSMQLDTARTEAEIHAFVDSVIAFKGIGTTHHHTMSAQTATNLDVLCSYLKTKRNLGQIVVTTVDSLWPIYQTINKAVDTYTIDADGNIVVDADVNYSGGGYAE